MNKILLIDGNSIVYRAYFGTAYSPRGLLKNSHGFPINAILIFSKMLEKVKRNYEPTHIFIAFDAGSKTKRHDKLPSYKAGRSKTPHELIQQLPLIKEMLDLMQIKHFEIPEVEADDIVGTLSNRFKNDNDVLVLSSDRDLLQLVSERVKMIIPQNGNQEDKVISLDSFKEVFGYTPDQVPDIKGLVGDASDNLKGVEGIGPKSAVSLLNKYNCLETLYQNIDEVTGKTHEKLIKDKNMAFLCKELATIDTNVDLSFKLNDLRYQEDISLELIIFFKRIEIFSLVKYYETKIEQQLQESELSLDNLIL